MSASFEKGISPSQNRSLLDREIESRKLSEIQSEVDGLVGSAIATVSDEKMMASLLGAGLAGRLIRLGALSSSLNLAAPWVAQVFSHTTALAGESAVFAGMERKFAQWEGHAPIQSFQKDWARAFINLGSIKLLGGAARGQNLVTQHLLIDAGMVAGHHAGHALGITEKPSGRLAQQMIQAEGTNLGMKGSLALLHGVAPRLSAMERSLDLSLRSQESKPSFPENSLFPFPHPLMAGDGRSFSARSTDFGPKGPEIWKATAKEEGAKPPLTPDSLVAALKIGMEAEWKALSQLSPNENPARGVLQLFMGEQLHQTLGSLDPQQRNPERSKKLWEEFASRHSQFKEKILDLHKIIIWTHQQRGGDLSTEEVTDLWNRVENSVLSLRSSKLEAAIPDLFWEAVESQQRNKMDPVPSDLPFIKVTDPAAKNILTELLIYRMSLVSRFPFLQNYGLEKNVTGLKEAVLEGNRELDLSPEQVIASVLKGEWVDPIERLTEAAKIETVHQAVDALSELVWMDHPLAVRALLRVLRVNPKNGFDGLNTAADAPLLFYPERSEAQREALLALKNMNPEVVHFFIQDMNSNYDSLLNVHILNRVGHPLAGEALKTCKPPYLLVPAQVGKTVDLDVINYRYYTALAGNEYVKNFMKNEDPTAFFILALRNDRGKEILQQHAWAGNELAARALGFLDGKMPMERYLKERKKFF